MAMQGVAVVMRPIHHANPMPQSLMDTCGNVGGGCGNEEGHLW